MKNWIFSIVVNAIFSSIISLILPDGKTSKTIKSIISLLLVIVILQPVINLSNDEILLGDLYGNEVIIQTSYLDYFNKKTISEKEKYCAELLSKYGIDNSLVDIIFETDDKNTIIIKKIQINLKNSGIYSDKDNIYIIARAKNAIKDFLSVKEEQIEFYE